MERRPRSPHYTRQVTLPSGRQIEVVYFDAHDPSQDSDGQELHLCGGCGCEFVQPVDWAIVSKSYWSVTLACPNCRWSGTGVYEQEVVDRYDEELHRGAELLSRDVERLSHEIMADSLEGFVRALRADQILPSDF